MTDIVPCLAYLAIVALASLTRRPVGCRWSCVAPIAASFAIRGYGAFSNGGYPCNVAPRNVEQASDRLWDWRDPPFLRRAVADGRACETRAVSGSSSYREHLPTAALRSRVACYWTLEATSPEPSRVLPDGCMDLLFDVGGTALPQIIGAMTKPVVSTYSASGAHLLGVRFRPGEAVAFLSRLPARHVRDAVVPLSELWGPVATEIGQRLVDLRDTPSRLRCLDRALMLRETQPADTRLTRALDAIVHARGSVRIGPLAASVGVGERQLERLFDARVGIGPKTFARVVRVHALWTHLRPDRSQSQRPTTDWARLAAVLGWSDQAHLTRDLRDLAGLTPTELSRAFGMSDSFNPPFGPLPILPE